MVKILLKSIVKFQQCGSGGLKERVTVGPGAKANEFTKQAESSWRNFLQMMKTASDTGNEASGKSNEVDGIYSSQ